MLLEAEWTTKVLVFKIEFYMIIQKSIYNKKREIEENGRKGMKLRLINIFPLFVKLDRFDGLKNRPFGTLI